MYFTAIFKDLWNYMQVEQSNVQKASNNMQVAQNNT